MRAHILLPLESQCHSVDYIVITLCDVDFVLLFCLSLSLAADNYDKFVSVCCFVKYSSELLFFRGKRSFVIEPADGARSETHEEARRFPADGEAPFSTVINENQSIANDLLPRRL